MNKKNRIKKDECGCEWWNMVKGCSVEEWGGWMDQDQVAPVGKMWGTYKLFYGLF